tara:strand:+ start:287 stop:505 length:219 start_codon:yes stop_codon:yes gene_type:complete
MFRRKLTNEQIEKAILDMDEDSAIKICLCVLRDVMVRGGIDWLSALIHGDKVTVKKIKDAHTDNVVPLRRVK